jgi:hypothetical protein
MITAIIDNYKSLLQNLPELINVSGYRNDFISRKMGLSAATFSAKKKRGNWSADEVMQLIKIIKNEEVDDYLMLQLMRGNGKDETITADEFRKEVQI